jgi:hypothetical protein
MSQTEQATAFMGFAPTHTLKVSTADNGHDHVHVAIEWEGGVLWLDMSDLVDHYCIDVRQLRDGDEIPMGTFALQAGRRMTLDQSNIPTDERLTAYGWPACEMPVLLTEKS